MLNFNNNLKTASSILIQAMNTPEVAAELGAGEGSSTQLNVDDGRTNPQLLDANGPFVYVAGESTSATDAKGVVIRAQQRIRQELVDRQRSVGAPPETYLTMVDVVAPTTPKIKRTVRIKISGIALVMSFVLGLSIAYAWQTFRGNRRRPTEGELSPTPEDIGLGSSREHDRHDVLHRAEQEWSGDQAAKIAKIDLAVGEQPVEAVPQDLESVATARQHRPEAEQVADAEQPTTDGDNTPLAAKQAAESESDPDPFEEAQTKEVWDLYIVEYPPAAGVAASSSEDDEFDWSLEWGLDGLDSERGSAVLGHQRGG